MPYTDPVIARQKANERSARWREKMKAERPEEYKLRVKAMHARAYERMKADPDKYAKYIKTMSDAAKRRWADPEHRRVKQDAQRRYLSDPNNKAKHAATVKRNTKARRIFCRWLFRQFKMLGCAVCGQTDWCIIDAHHANPESKLFGIAKYVHSGKGVRLLAPELNKCVPLCKNCHWMVHAGKYTCPSIPRTDWHTLQIPQIFAELETFDLMSPAPLDVTNQITNIEEP